MYLYKCSRLYHIPRYITFYTAAIWFEFFGDRCGFLRQRCRPAVASADNWSKRGKLTDGRGKAALTPSVLNPRLAAP